jgi:GNAT superfamily N-acetyltransferase
MNSAQVSIRRLTTLSATSIDQLADVLLDCVHGGASVSFMHPFSREQAIRFWTQLAASVASRDRVVLVAEDEHGVCGTVQLVLNVPENQPHRADLAKMLVHRRARRQGVGVALMQAAASAARVCGKSLLVLDTVTGGDAERLYHRLGWSRVGVIPNYALMPTGEFCGTTIFYRDVPPGQTPIP